MLEKPGVRASLSTSGQSLKYVILDLSHGELSKSYPKVENLGLKKYSIDNFPNFVIKKRNERYSSDSKIRNFYRNYSLP